MLNASQLKTIVPHATQKAIELFLPYLVNEMPRYEINTKLRVAAFIAQLAHESGSFRYTREIASGSAYEGRKDLGNIYKGDGVKYKGRGLVQITGRANYQECSKALFGDGEVLQNNPDLLSTPIYAVESACWFWKSRGLNELADGSFFTLITKRINGGTTGIKERRAFYKRALKVLS